ncbi:DUF2726 domain-containing protein [Deinococcus psychrotolerans]|uniref:DUF2726 domain-containing protein n=1 Tax=Deinococcus psychrotolerans TaxID=2489213 RepID=A0A3G8Y998_9DEIO|nr:DUF2726 domain-containing protein [Deinococcus psychrotolerans]AZI41473.1 DUF2726 domain-containing protein [Deinococcus psychrotolerans]
MTAFLLILTAAVLTGLLLWLRQSVGLRWAGAEGAEAANGADPEELELPPQFRLHSGFDSSFSPDDALPIKTRQHLFGTGESNLYAELLATLAGSSYKVFPNIRLGQVFQEIGESSSPTLSILRDQTVGFLVVETPEFRPVLGLMLVGRAYGAEVPPRSSLPAANTKLVTLAFRSARLPLLHIDAKRNIDAEELSTLVMPHLMRM